MQLCKQGRSEPTLSTNIKSKDFNSQMSLSTVVKPMNHSVIFSTLQKGV